ncbi:hypothetical protein DM02DRAFT_602165 [Periconia macrospinosa]|uniref:Uncharacterized protein n=1 Tax=Periconia macrospinosa TaxID=97972 RepID=A0A2V1D963_9PLEO|nr:hypothetical protein DM02DRAFT_602165 [Periconia macrospinosa]
MSASTADGKCKARLLSDKTGQTECDKPATSVDGRLCAFHSRQCQGLYRGYKRRNAQLDALSASPPPFLANTKVALVNQTFKDIEDAETLDSLFKYLFRKYNLLEKVIRGRKLHHSHFFAIDNDYGHEKYLVQLVNDKQITERALETLCRQSAQVVYKQKKWIGWVQERQEGDSPEAESRKIKLQAQLFKRHQKEVEKRQRELRAKEFERLQDAYLEEAYSQRLSEMSDEAQDEWDPIQDVVEDERGTFVDLIKYFLMLKDEDEVESTEGNGEASKNDAPAEKAAMSKSAKKRAKKERAEERKAFAAPSGDPEQRGPDTIEMETKSQMRKRLQEGVKYARVRGYHAVGSLENPSQLHEKAAAIPDDEIDTLLDEVAEVKALLFCRLLLSHATLLPIALRANSIEQFLENPEVTSANVRDLCLKLERPALQDVRDACADFVRAKAGENGEDTDSDEGDSAWEDTDDDEENRVIPKKYRFQLGRPDETMPQAFKTKREQAVQKQRQRRKEQKLLGEDRESGAVDFGEIEDEHGNEPTRKVRIKICGRYITNFPSEKALPRGGWYHFCLIAKDSDLNDAIELCRNWNEFFELNTLCMFHYFPAAKWMVWVGDLQRLQLLRLGFIPYYQSDRADLLTVHQQTGSRGLERRAHHIREARNFICGHIKRNDPASRRLIQYLSMLTFELLVLVRDAKTGDILVKPPKEERWLIREKIGWGRASKNEYKDIAWVGPKFFEAMDKYRKWHFNFEDHYDLYIWDAISGRTFDSLNTTLTQQLMKAHRVRELKDVYKVVEPVIKTLTKDPETDRIRSIRPDEEVKSLWNDINDPSMTFHLWTNGHEAAPDQFDKIKYNEADALEDEILFPEEADEEDNDYLFRPDKSAMTRFEDGDLGDIRDFALDLDSDEEPYGLGSDEEPYDSDLDEGDSSDFGEFASDDEFVESEEAQKAYDAFSKRFQEQLSLAPGSRRQHYVFDNFNDPSNPLDLSLIPEHMRKTDADVMALMRLSLIKQKDYSDTSNATLEKEFFRHIDRKKSKIFKDSFHAADSGGPKYFLFSLMVQKMDDYQMNKLTLAPFEMISSMRAMEKLTLDRRVVDDAFFAYATISLFYESEDFWKSKHAELLKLPLFQNLLDGPSLVNQAERAKQVPDKRTSQSNKMLPKGFWDEWDAICRENQRDMTDGIIEHFYPAEWDKVVRPKIARLYKAGIITNIYTRETAGIAVAHAEPGRAPDLYIDYRLTLEQVRELESLQDPRKFTRSRLLTSARTFASKHTNARFAALRVWSSDYFYPLMLGYWNRSNVSFLDGKGRGWEWKFVPKDMPFSEWSIHEQTRSRIRPFKDFFGDKVIVATDLYFVMGEDEAELRKLAAGVTFAVQTEPWRMEIDFWKSFVGVDLAFLEGLDEAWLRTATEG